MKASAIALPMPADAPVIRARLPFNLPSMKEPPFGGWVQIVQVGVTFEYREGSAFCWRGI
ncbi:hypothetical protein D3C81_2156870 [compost metagenome]